MLDRMFVILAILGGILMIRMIADRMFAIVMISNRILTTMCFLGLDLCDSGDVG